MRVELIEESRRKLYESKDFVELARLGHELIEGGGSADCDAPVEASFRCTVCGDLIRFRDLAWGLELQPLWVLSEMSGGDRSQDCRARRARRMERKRFNQAKLLERWKRFRWTATNRDHFN